MTVAELIQDLLEQDVKAEIWVDPTYFVEDQLVYEPVIRASNGKVYIL